MYMKKFFTLVFIRNDEEVLLGLKKRGFGQNKWNGFGGKLESNESIKEAAARELKEESCLTVKPVELNNVGHLQFTFEGDSLMMDVRVFMTRVYEGTPTETEEMMPKWFHISKIPYNNMWPDDKYWFPYMLNDSLFYGRFHYRGFETILNYTIEEFKSMEEFYAGRK